MWHIAAPCKGTTRSWRHQKFEVGMSYGLLQGICDDNGVADEQKRLAQKTGPAENRSVPGKPPSNVQLERDLQRNITGE